MAVLAMCTGNPCPLLVSTHERGEPDHAEEVGSRPARHIARRLARHDRRIEHHQVHGLQVGREAPPAGIQVDAVNPFARLNTVMTLWCRSGGREDVETEGVILTTMLWSGD
jgi:hypothetical protein